MRLRSTSLGLVSQFQSSNFDPDAASYINAVEAADGLPLETAVKAAINSFVVGCKADGIWISIKSSCILSGARTLSGALVPLVGVAPSSFNFVTGDYNRKTGLKGDGTTKYINSNRNNNADPQDSRSLCLWVSEADTIRNNTRIIAAGDSTLGDTYIVAGIAGPVFYNFTSSSSNFLSSVSDTTLNFIGTSRSSSTTFDYRLAGNTASATLASVTPRNENFGVFGRVTRDGRDSNCRASFYSIGLSLNLALLDARVTTLINAFASAIP